MFSFMLLMMMVQYALVFMDATSFVLVHFPQIFF